VAGDEPSEAGGLGDLLAQLQAAQAGLEAQSAAIDATVVEGHAAGGAVVVRLTGSLEVESVHIDPSLADPNDSSLLEDAVLAAVRDALGRVVELRSALQAEVEAPFGGGLDLNAIVGNLDLGGLFGGGDVGALMANLGMGMDLGALGAPGSAEDEEVEDDDVDDGPEA
jgi:DNA-binding YbaB/EbfC family protein